MSLVQQNPLDAFQWHRQPAAEQLVRELVSDFIGKNDFARTFAQRLQKEAGVRFVDMVDHLCLPTTESLRARLQAAGFERNPTELAIESYEHVGGMFPVIAMHTELRTLLALKVESVADFVACWKITFAHMIEGIPGAPMRRAKVDHGRETEMWVVERHGNRGFSVPDWSAEKTLKVLQHGETFRRRVRTWGHDNDGFRWLHTWVDDSIKDLGVDYTCDLFFAAEREYWMRRNLAARVQKARQDTLGIGWANHDHHTYRSSREHFKDLIAVHEKLGLVCRERFYAGKEAGWGAQVMEQPICGIITFNDVDLSPEELMGDFSHYGLAPSEHLGTVGLWCALHGEAILQAGMHHLEAQFDFDALRDQLKDDGVNMMKPFTNFPFLRQAFTEGERWKVSETRIVGALKSGYITEQQAKQFREQGAIGSHLENLERNEGFKGFNQTGVSEIIAATDPRKQFKV